MSDSRTRTDLGFFEVLAVLAACLPSHELSLAVYPNRNSLVASRNQCLRLSRSTTAVGKLRTRRGAASLKGRGRQNDGLRDDEGSMERLSSEELSGGGHHRKALEYVYSLFRGHHTHLNAHPFHSGSVLLTHPSRSSAFGLTMEAL